MVLIFGINKILFDGNKTISFLTQYDELHIPEPNDGVLLADVALGLVFGGFSGRQTMQHRQPDQTLRLLLQPIQEVHGLNGLFVFAGLLEAAAHRGLDVGASKGSHLTQLPRHLDAVVQQQSQFALVGHAVWIGNQPEQIWKIIN